jgi:hypothetical protein
MATEVVEPVSDPASHPSASNEADKPPASDDDEGVEVVMDSHGKPEVMERSDQNVFRAPNPVRPRAMRGALPPHVQSSGSYGYPPHDYGARPHYPPYALSGSFDDGGYHHPPASHYSPHVQHPPPGGRHPEDVNVISPHHGTPRDHRPPMTPSRRYGHHQYPPTSPVSRPGSSATPPRVRSYAMRRPEGPYSAATRGHGPPEEGGWNNYSTPAGERPRPPLVTESFDSEHYSAHPSHSIPATPSEPHYGPPMHPEPHYSGSFYGASFGGSFDSHAPPPPHFDDYRYYGHSSHHPPHHPPESPYSPYAAPYNGYSPGSYYDPYSPHADYGRGYEDANAVTPSDRKKDSASGLLPKAAEEIDFEVTDPPLEPVTPPSTTPVCDSPGEVNTYDVLCGRGGGTNSQVGNRRFRRLVQDFQPVYLLARRKEKPLLARTIVLIIRKRGGRFLKKDEETGELYEVGDIKAEAKTSQALREGLDVRATKSAASDILNKKKKKKSKSSKSEDEDEDQSHDSPVSKGDDRPGSNNLAQSPPSLPRLNGEEKPNPPSPTHDQMHFRKRRRMRSSDGVEDTTAGCATGFQDKFFSDFCPPRAEIGRPASPSQNMGDVDMTQTTPTRSNAHYDDDDDIRAEHHAQSSANRGCAGIAMDMVTGAATSSFCLGPRSWR